MPDQLNLLHPQGHRIPSSRRPVFPSPLLPILLLVLLIAGSSFAAAQAEPGATRAEPVPFGAEAPAGPLRLTVLEVVTAAAALDLVTAAGNDAPRDGLAYVAVRLRAANDGDQPLSIDQNDFALTGASGQVRRFVGATAPDPALEGVVAPGETREGWVVLAAAADEASLLLVFDLSDFRVQALGADDAVDVAPWVALRLRVTNVAAGGEPAFLPATAFMLVTAEGNAANDVITLTAPYPEAAGYYYPGASREGWVSIEVPEPYMATDLSLIRFLPWRTDTDPRYLTYGEEYPDC